MVKQIFKRLIAVASSAVMCVSMSGGMVSAVEEDYSSYGLGNIIPTAEEEAMFFSRMENQGISTAADYSDVPIATSVDLCDSGYFPNIGDQGSLNSCTAWATTYYQFTYEVNKLNNIIINDDNSYDNSYSPRWTYNLTNFGSNIGTSYLSCYEVLMHQGALKMPDCPYNGNAYNYDFSWSTDIDAMIEALDTKMCGYGDKKIITTSSQKIISKTDSDLNEIKRYLCAGKVLTVTVSADPGLPNWSIKNTSAYGKVVYRASKALGSHAMVIVGYDDNVRCDVNGNGTFESSEYGAFKVVNSWGEGWGNNGTIWVLYDALNYQSANRVNNWEASENGTRTAIFDGNGNDPTDPEDVSGANVYSYIEVENCDVNLVGLLTFSTDYPYNADFYTNRGTTASYPSSDQTYSFGIIHTYQDYVDNENIPTPTAPFNGTVVFDFGYKDDNIKNYLWNYKWFVNIVIDSYGGNLNNVSYKIVDNQNNLIHNVGGIAAYLTPNDPYARNATLQLRLGDVDYSKTLTDEDAQMILQIAATFGKVANLRMVLADYNEDGVVNSRDAAGLRADLSAKEAAEFDVAIAEMYHQIQSNARTMRADNEDFDYDKYAEMVTELYYEFVIGG